MSTRRIRDRSDSYTTRLRRRQTKLPRRSPLRWLATPRWLAVGLLLAEANHFVAAFVEWPEAPLRGLFHVLVASGQGFAAIGVYSGLTRRSAAAGLAAALAPIGWLASLLAGAPAYQHYPLLAGAMGSAIELTVATLLATQLRPAAQQFAAHSDGARSALPRGRRASRGYQQGRAY